MKILADKCKRIETVGKSEKTKSCFFEKKKSQIIIIYMFVNIYLICYWG